MEADAIAQLVTLLMVTLLMVGLGIVWHQQRSTDKLREDFQTANRNLREEFQTANRNLREEFQTANRQLRQDHDKLREAIAQSDRDSRASKASWGSGIPSAPDESTGTEPD